MGSVKGKSESLSFLLLLTVLVFLPDRSLAQSDISPRHHEEIILGFDSWLEGRGVEREFSERSLSHLQALTLDYLQKVRNSLQKEDFGKFDKDWFEKQELFLEESLKHLSASLEPQATLKEKWESFSIGKKIFYMIKSREKMELLDQNRKKVVVLRGPQIKNGLRGALRFFMRARLLNVPIPDLHQPVGSHKAPKESRFLRDPEGEGKEFVSPEKLALMTPLEIAGLDISETHPSWHTKKYLQSHPDIWKDNEEWVERAITSELKKKHKIDRSFPSFSYSLQKAHKVVFFDGLRTSGTSPKIDTKDAFGVGWKMKWGDEIHSEIVANRLYVALGARFVDLTYGSAPGSSRTVLILEDPLKKDSSNSGPGKCFPVNLRDFVKCLKKSRYEYDITPYVHSSGILTQENVQAVLQHLPPEAIEKYRAQKLIGRHYITFKEAVLEVRPKGAATSGGPSSCNRFGMEHDRVARGLLLFNSWINNGDISDDNRKTYLLKNYPGAANNPGKSEYFFSEGQHDMGKSLGGIISSGSPNALKEAGEFAHNTGGHIRFNMFLVHFPRSYSYTTFPDLLWMGEKIAGLSRKKIEDIVAQTYWPDFMQKAMVHKLLVRRNRLVQILGLSSLLAPEERDLTPPSQKISLATREERIMVAEQYHLPLDRLEEALEKKELLNIPYKDTVLSEGKVASCPRSVLIRLLHLHAHPTGLDRRRGRLGVFDRLNFHRPCGGIKKEMISI